MPEPVSMYAVPARSGNPFPEPFRTVLGDSEWRGLGEHFGLSQFAVNFEILQPGAQSALRHWHARSDEFLYLMAGSLVLVTDEGEAMMQAGMCVGFPAGEPNGHHLVNRSSEPASFIVVGTRVEGVDVNYPDDDIQWVQAGSGYQATRKDGTPYD